MPEIIPHAGGQMPLPAEHSKIPQPGGQIVSHPILALCCSIPWKHNVMIIEKLKDPEQVLFYLRASLKTQKPHQNC